MPYKFSRKNLNYIVVIPARYKSSRLQGKPLIDLNGVPMIIRTYRQCLKVVPSRLIYIATDNELIKKVCNKERAQVIMTSSKCLTGTDRVTEVSKKIKAKTYINVQGDEPIFNPADLKLLLKEIKKYPNDIITGYCEIDNEKDHKDPNVPKVVVSSHGRLLYASRAPIPSNKANKFEKGWRQVCAYAFPEKVLKVFSSVKKKTELEKIEDIEYLRFLEMEIKVRVLKMSKMSLAVDTPKDVLLVKKIISKLNLK
jgi:3-deoxy-manno-octulosonate cytidylyltransferase (CMP-KDO synthetase)